MTARIPGLVRLVYRLPLLCLHLLVTLPPTLPAHVPGVSGLQVGSRTLSERMLHVWSGGILVIFGVRLTQVGAPAEGPVLMAANHISWMDIPLLHSIAAISFVSKAEVADVPIIGTIARVGGTLFHRRGSHDSARGVASVMAERLKTGARVLIFPEGGILHGEGVKRFHARLFRPAVEANTPVQPVAIAYRRNGEPNRGFEFRKGETVLGNFFRVLTQAPSEAWLVFCDTRHADGSGRSELAAASEAAVRDALENRVPRS